MLDLVIRGGRIVDGTGANAFTGDVGVSDGVITEVGKIDSSARREVDAAGALVTPGFVDCHTHYDGQVTWDDRLEASQTNGNTTVINGNCGVGFAPIRPGRSADLIDLMEGVEDIPGTALYEGVPWGEWETFPEYLAYVGQRQWAVDVGFQVPHGPLRQYVMGQRGHDADPTARAASPDELATMARLTQEACEAGALGFSTSRILFHRAVSGYSVPGTYAPEEELTAILGGLRAGGARVMQAIPGGGVTGMYDPWKLVDEVRLFGRLSREQGITVTFTLYEDGEAPERWREAMAIVTEANANGAHVKPMVAPRCSTILTSLQTYHMFMLRPTYKKLSHLPVDELVAELRRPEVKRAILSEEDDIDRSSGSMENVLPPLFQNSLDKTYPLGDPIDYEPAPEDALGARAKAAGRDQWDYFYDFLVENGGRNVGMYFIANYAHGNLDIVREMLLDENTVSGLSDAGAHVQMICDASNSPFHLTHWVRDRSRGDRIPLELAIRKVTSAPAQIFGLNDRGVIAVGKRADLNVIDLDNLRIEQPFVRADLPAGGRRFLQSSSGFLLTVVNGVATLENDVDTEQRPGRVARRSA